MITRTIPVSVLWFLGSLISLSYSVYMLVNEPDWGWVIWCVLLELVTLVWFWVVIIDYQHKGKD